MSVDVNEARAIVRKADEVDRVRKAVERLESQFRGKGIVVRDSSERVFNSSGDDVRLALGSSSLASVCASIDSHLLAAARDNLAREEAALDIVRGAQPRPNMTPKQRATAIAVASQDDATIEGKQWALDQMLRALLEPDEYRVFREDNPLWSEGEASCMRSAPTR